MCPRRLTCLRTVLTGEEGDETVFSTRAKLFVIESEAYRETGVGTLRLNKEALRGTGACRLRMLS